jgi:hypothetical protein
MIFAPLFLTMCLWNSELPSWILALIIVHGTQKALTEGHVFALAIVLCSSLLRSDFGLEKSDCNLAISLLIATKAEVFIPMLKFLYRSRCIYMIDPDLFDRRLIQILGMQLMQWVVGWLPGPDMYLKVPCLVWSAISGSSVLLAGGSPYLILPGAIRPFCFFDWPMKERGGVRTMFTRNISDYPVETPVYTSASMALAKKFGRIVRKGKIGSVTCGDMFLFRCGALSIVLSVVAIEPVSYHIQLRGLEYNSRMGCHEDESFFLDELVESASAASLAACSVLSSYELRQKYVPLKLYSVTKTPVSDAFLGVNGDVIKQWFLFAYCRSIAKGGVVAAQIQAVDANYRDSAEVERLMRVIFSLMDYQTDNIPVYVGFWSVFDGILFEDQVLKTNELTEMFKGLIHVPDEFSWVYSAGSTLNDLVISTVRMGAALSFLASSGVAPSMELETDEVTFLRQALDFTMECEQDCVIAPLDAEEFEREFFRGKKVGLIGMEVVMGMPCVLRFVKYEEEWSVFQLCPAFVHALWGSQARAILFWGNQESERLAISGNVEFLNNMILQSCDSPIGYPAYTSGFLDSLVDPLVL